MTDALSALETEFAEGDMRELHDADAERFLAVGLEFRAGLEHAMHREIRRGDCDLAGVRAWLREAEYHQGVLNEVRDRRRPHQSVQEALGDVRMARWMSTWMEREGLSVDEAARELGRRVSAGEPMPWDEFESALLFEMSFDPCDPATEDVRSTADDLLSRVEGSFVALGMSGPLGLLIQQVALKGRYSIEDGHPQYGALLGVVLFGYATRMAQADRAPLPKHEVALVDRWLVPAQSGGVDHDELSKDPDAIAQLVGHAAALADDRLRLLRLLHLRLDVWLRFNRLAGKQLNRNFRRNGVKRRLLPPTEAIETLIRLGCAVRIIEEVADESPMPASAVRS